MDRPQFTFCFTLDTEPDDLWANRPSLAFEHFKRLPAFHKRLVQAGARPTYLTTSEVVEDADARDALLSCADESEIGAHFHTWTREWPFRVPQLQPKDLHAMAHQLGEEVETAMLDYTCEALERATGKRPQSYRGGRWSLGPSSPRAFKRCGIRIDSTVTPGLSWEDPRHPLLDGPDYTRASRVPYFLENGENGNRILEIPVGAAWMPAAAARLGPGMQKQVRRAGKLLGTPLGHRWLRPTYVPLKDLVATMKQMRSDNIPVWVFMIHSSEIAPCTPLPTEEAVSAFVDRCEGAVRAAVELGATGTTLTEAAQPFFDSAPASIGHG